MPCKTLKNDSPRPRIRIPRKTTYPSYLYRRGQFFYFRYVLPERYRKQGKTELRLSLQTPYLRVAKELAQRLRQALNQMIGMLMDYETLRLRLNGLLRAILEQDTRDFSERPSVTIPGIGTISYGEYYNRCSNIDYFNLQTEKGLLAAAQNVIPMLLRQGLIRQEDIRTPQDILLITKEYLRMEITRNRILKCREDGDFMTERAVFAENYIPFSPSQNDFSVPASQPQSIAPRYRLTELIEKYVSVKINDGDWKATLLVDHKNRLNYLPRILGDRFIDEISRQDMRLLRDTLKRLPQHWKKKYPTLSIQDILAKNETNCLSVKTVNIVIEAIASFFEWCIREEYFTKTNPAKSLQLKDNRQEIELRDALTEDDLKTIFSSPRFQNKKAKNPAYYWVPLIGAYSGMRLEEICQLHTNDVYEIEGVWVFDINTKPSKDTETTKEVKNKNAVRLVPIHPELLTVGLLDYIETIRNSGQERIFPALNKTEKSPRYGKQVGKQFTDVIKYCGIEGKKSFHSLRHTFSDFLNKINYKTIFLDKSTVMNFQNLLQNNMDQNLDPKNVQKKSYTSLSIHSF